MPRLKLLSKFSPASRFSKSDIRGYLLSLSSGFRGFLRPSHASALKSRGLAHPDTSWKVHNPERIAANIQCWLIAQILNHHGSILSVLEENWSWFLLAKRSKVLPYFRSSRQPKLH